MGSYFPCEVGANPNAVKFARACDPIREGSRKIVASRAMRRVWIALISVVACGGTKPRPAATTAPRASIEAHAFPFSNKVEPDFAITFAPNFDPPSLGVHVRAKARAHLERWSAIDRAAPHAITLRDAAGEIAFENHDGQIVLSRAPKDFVEINSTIAGSTAGDVVVSHAGYVRFYGEAILLPTDLAENKTHVTIDFALDRAPVEGVASSFGNGKHIETDIELGDLSKGVWMAGAVFTTSFHAYEGDDEFSWIGYSAFDPRWVSAEIATLRTAVSNFFGDAHPPRFRMLFTIDRRTQDVISSSPISIYPRWQGLFATVDIDAPWSISARMSVAMGLVSRFVGSIIRGPIVPGLTRYIAREVLLASGTMTPNEYADEVNGEIAATLFADKNPEAASTARVALDANRVDAILKNESHGKRAVRELVREWIQSRANMTGADLASFAEGAFDDHAFGKCFRRGPMRFEELDLGFDEPRTRETKTITGVRGAAKLAGLKDGDAIVSFRYDEGQAARPVRVVVTRDGKESTITYRPIGRTKNDLGWHVVPGIDPATCSQ